MDAMRDALMKRRMRAAELEEIDPQEESLQEGEMGLMGAEEMPLDDQEEGTDLAPALQRADEDQALAAQAFKPTMEQGDPDELVNLEKMFDGGSSMNNKGFMGKAALKMKDRLAQLKK